jgi:hypothetical protein
MIKNQLLDTLKNSNKITNSSNKMPLAKQIFEFIFEKLIRL